MPAINVIILAIIVIAMVAFTLVIAWSSLDRNKLSHDD